MGKTTAYDIERKQGDPNPVMHVGHRAAWEHYVRGNVVSESSVTLITNILSACSAMAHPKDDDEERNEEKQRGHRVYSVMGTKNVIYTYMNLYGRL